MLSIIRRKSFLLLTFVIIVCLSFSLFVISKRILPKNIKRFYKNIIIAKKHDLSSIQSFAIEREYGSIPGKYYSRSRLLKQKDSLYTTSFLLIELDTTNDSIISKHATISEFTVNKMGKIIKREIIGPGQISSEFAYYELFKNLNKEYGIEKLISMLDFSEKQFWFQNGRLYYKYFPPVHPEFLSYEYWMRPWIKIDKEWLFIPY